MAFVAFRGATRLKDEIELQANLAALLRLENVGLLVGAGASCPAGGLTVKKLWDDFVNVSPDAATWLANNRFIEAAAVAAAEERRSPNVESLVDAIEIALSDWSRTGDAKLADGKWAKAELFRAVVRAAILKQEWWMSPSGVEFDLAGLEHHRAILQKFTAARQPGQSSPWVFTTNYDLAIEWAAESIDMQVMNGFLGIHSRRFSPQSFDLGFRNVQARGEARFGVYNIYLAKLHGSLTWKSIDGQLFELAAPQAWGDQAPFRDGATDELAYLVLPRAAKYLETVGYVLGELLRRFAEFLARPQTALIIAGYGFGDEHINRLIRSALLNPTLQLVIYLPEFNGDMKAPSLPPSVRHLLSLQNPRVTIVGGGSEAYIDVVARQLPEPSIYDDTLQDLERKLRPFPPGNAEIEDPLA